MLKNYFRLAWRKLGKDKLSSFINIGGLTIGLATGIIIMLVVSDELSYDKFNSHLSSTYLLMGNQKETGDIFTGRSTPGPLAASLRDEMPGVQYATHTSYPDQELIKVGENSTYESAIYAESDFFRIMTYQALEGDPVSALQDPRTVVITERMAKKLFPNEDALGKTIIHNNTNGLKVGAVIRDVPSNSTMQFDVVLPFRIYELADSDWINNWEANRLLTWAQLKPGASLTALNSQLADLLKRKQNDTAMAFFAYPFADLRLHGNFKNGKPNGGLIETVTMLSAIGIFVLLIACVNFMNLATAQSEMRAREVGVRKTLGASRKSLFFQFLSEALMMTFSALVLAAASTELILPVFNKFMDRHLSLGFSDWKMWALLAMVGLLTGLIAGSYPAFILSNYQPVKVLRRAVLTRGRGAILRKGLVTFQFIISISLIITTIVIYKQLQHLEQRPIGYNNDNLVEIPLRGRASKMFGLIKNQLAAIPGVKDVSGGNNDLLSFGQSSSGMEWTGKTGNQNFPITITVVQYDWTKTTGIKIVEGRDFSQEFGSDTVACLLNQMAVRRMGLKEPVIGQKLEGNTIIGVVEDFVYNNPSGAPRPMAIYLDTGSMSHLFVRFHNDAGWQSSLAGIEKIIKDGNPGFPFDVHLIKDEYEKKFLGIQSVGRLSNTFSGMAILISCLGLFGLSAFLAERRKKEISIRKVLGASTGNLWFLLSKDFLKPVIIAFLIATPLAIYAMQKMLDSYDYRIRLAWWMFALGGFLAILIAFLTVSFQGIKTALSNPIKALKSE